jgi:hypothetical protein
MLNDHSTNKIHSWRRLLCLLRDSGCFDKWQRGLCLVQAQIKFSSAQVPSENTSPTESCDAPAAIAVAAPLLSYQLCGLSQFAVGLVKITSKCCQCDLGLCAALWTLPPTGATQVIHKI